MPVLSFIAAWGLALGAPPQETPVPEPEKLCEDLQKKFDALGSVSGKVSLDAVNLKGERTPRFKGVFHARLSEGWLYFEAEDVQKEKGTGCALFDGERPMIAWQEGKDGTRLDQKE